MAKWRHREAFGDAIAVAQHNSKHNGSKLSRSQKAQRSDEKKKAAKLSRRKNRR